MSNELELCLITHVEACMLEDRAYGPAGREAELKELVGLGFLEYSESITDFCSGNVIRGDFWQPTSAGLAKVEELLGR